MFYNDYEREELEAEFFAEDPGAVAARRHNEWEAHWARLEAEECDNCGDLGYTIEVNADGEEFIDGCDPCWIAAQEAEQAKKEAA